MIPLAEMISVNQPLRKLEEDISRIHVALGKAEDNEEHVNEESQTDHGVTTDTH